MRIWERYVPQIDWYSGWLLPAFVKGWQVIRDNQIDGIIVTGPPFSAMIVGALLSRFSGAKLFLDFRDSWADNMALAQPRFRRGLAPHMEKLAVKSAAAVVVCSPVMQQNFVSRYNGQCQAPCHVVTSGFWPREDVEPLFLETRKKTILYAGSFYGERRISVLARPIVNLIQQGLLDKDFLTVHVFGTISPPEQELLRRHGIADMFQTHPLATHQTIVKYMRGSDILLLISGTDVGYAIPFKAFDYLSVRRPILAIVPRHSALADLMRTVDCGELAWIHDEATITESLRKMLFEDPTYTYANLQKYTWDRLAEKYATIIKSVLTS